MKKKRSTLLFLLSGCSGFINNVTKRCNLVLSEMGKPIGIKYDVIYYKDTNTFWYWKEDEFIQNAHEAYDNKKFDEALKLYKVAFKENPKHLYLYNYIQYLNYVKDNSKDDLINQHQQFVGSYGPREFWIEDNMFFYKRKSKTIDLAKVELLPINKNTYMDLTRPNTLMLFETTDNGNINSVSHSYNIETEEWEQTKGGNNYFEKDK